MVLITRSGNLRNPVSRTRKVFPGFPVANGEERGIVAGHGHRNGQRGRTGGVRAAEGWICPQAGNGALAVTRNARIALNIAATYGRSLYALVVGLFTSRWALQALGEVDFGLVGVIGGLVGFIAFFNNMLASVVGRFYAVSVGRASVAENRMEALEETRSWFSTAVAIHTVVPTLLMLAGYPAGMWAVRNFLSIPPDRLADCEWVFRFVCVGAYLTMVSVPVQAMYTAKQYIAELTVYAFATTTLRAAGLWYMVSHPGVWLAPYGAMVCLLTAAPQAIIALRGFWLFPECRFRWRAACSLPRLKEIASFAVFQFVGAMGYLVRLHGVQVVVNKFFGARANAAMTVSTTVNAQTLALSAALVGAFQPAIVQAYGAGERDRMLALSYRACKLSALFVLFFILPLGLEIREVLRLWLGTPPAGAASLCLLTFAVTLLDQSTVGHRMAIMACPRQALFQTATGGVEVLTLPIAVIWCMLGGDLDCVLWSVLAAFGAGVVVRVVFARHMVGMSARYWVAHILLPLAGVALAASFAGALPRLCLPCSPLRVLATAGVCETVLLGLAWTLLFDATERAYALAKVRTAWERLGKGMKTP